MRFFPRSILFCGIVVLWLSTPTLAFCQIRSVGEVIVIGNTFTPDYVIRRELQALQPGQILKYSDVRNAENNLNSLGLFKGRATAQVLVGPGQFQDILVKVEERPLTWLYFAAWDVVLFRNTWDVDYLYDFESQIRNGIGGLRQ